MGRVRMASKGAIVGTYVATPDTGYNKKGYVRLDYADQHARGLKEFQKCISENLGKADIVDLARQMANGVPKTLTIKGKTFDVPDYVVSELRSQKLINSDGVPIDGRAVIRVALAAVANECGKGSPYVRARIEKYDKIQEALASGGKVKAKKRAKK